MAYQFQGTLQDFMGQGVGGDYVQGLNQFLPSLGLNLNDYYNVGGGNAEHGTYTAPSIDPSLSDALQGYTFGRTVNKDGSRALDVMQGGNVVGSYQTQKKDDFLDKVGPLAAGSIIGGTMLAGLGAFGPQAAGGVGTGGTGVAAGGGAMGMGDAIAAAGSATTPAAVGGGTMAAGGAGGLLGGGGGLGSLLGGVSNGQLLAGGLGALAGLQDTKDQKQTQQMKLDPRMEGMLYGQGGLLPAAQQWFQGAQNSPGMGLMNQGAQQMANFYSSPQYTQAFSQLKDTGMGLLGKGVAGNPFMGR